MSKKINLTYKGISYTLEFTRRTVQRLDSEGFRVDMINTQPATAVPMLFHGAFYAHHAALNQKVVDEIFDNIADKNGLFTALTEMYTEPITSMFEEKDAPGNATWAVMN